MRKLGAFLGVLMLTALVVPADADVLWDQWDEGFAGNTHYEAGGIVGAGGTFLGISYLEEYYSRGSDFTLAENSSITTVTFWTYIRNAGDASPCRVAIEFFANNSGLPANDNQTDNCRPIGWDPNDPNATLPWYAENGVTSYQGGEGTGWLYKGVMTIETGGGLTVTDSGYRSWEGDIIWEVIATLPKAFEADAGITYWMSVNMSDQTVAGASSHAFDMLVLNGVTGLYPAVEGNYVLWGGNYDYQFVLEGTVPEPATMSLLGLGGLGMLLRRKR